MWMSMPTPVTNNSQMPERGSSRKPASTLNSATCPPAAGQVVRLPVSLPSHVYITFSKGAPLWASENPAYCNTANADQTNATTTVPTQMPLTAAWVSFRPKKNISTAPNAGSSRTTHRWSRKNISQPSPLQQIYVVYIHRLAVAEKRNQDSQSHGGFRGGVGGHKDGKYLPLQPINSRERHQVQVHRVQDQLNGHQHNHYIASRQHSNRPNHEQRR